MSAPCSCDKCEKLEDLLDEGIGLNCICDECLPALEPVAKVYMLVPRHIEMIGGIKLFANPNAVEGNKPGDVLVVSVPIHGLPEPPKEGQGEVWVVSIHEGLINRVFTSEKEANKWAGPMGEVIRYVIHGAPEKGKCEMFPEPVDFWKSRAGDLLQRAETAEERLMVVVTTLAAAEKGEGKDEISTLRAQLDEAKRELGWRDSDLEKNGKFLNEVLAERDTLTAENAQLRDQVKQLHEEQRDWEAQAERTGDELRAAIDSRDGENARLVARVEHWKLCATAHASNLHNEIEDARREKSTVHVGDTPGAPSWMFDGEKRAAALCDGWLLYVEPAPDDMYIWAVGKVVTFGAHESYKGARVIAETEANSTPAEQESEVAPFPLRRPPPSETLPRRQATEAEISEHYKGLEREHAENTPCRECGELPEYKAEGHSGLTTCTIKHDCPKKPGAPIIHYRPDQWISEVTPPQRVEWKPSEALRRAKEELFRAGDEMLSAENMCVGLWKTLSLTLDILEQQVAEMRKAKP
ncbi:MAG: hypothetical protein V3W44_10925 [Dehalococcoidales bacterium]